MTRSFLGFLTTMEAMATGLPVAAAAILHLIGGHDLRRGVAEWESRYGLPTAAGPAERSS
ncbi:MAG TPA: hypothetical protein VKG80_12115 [Trebonia sp.]|nr:hypothetical protein [Trebonia sp.]